MLTLFAMKDCGAFYRGDEITFNVTLINSDTNALWYVPEGATVSAGLPGETTAITTTDTVASGGTVTVKFAAASTIEARLGQPIVVIVISKDTSAWTFEIRAPFIIKARALAI